MVKLMKKFFTGDKVFAKVRGYPPWPAKVSFAPADFCRSDGGVKRKDRIPTAGRRRSRLALSNRYRRNGISGPIRDNPRRILEKSDDNYS